MRQGFSREGIQGVNELKRRKGIRNGSLRSRSDSKDDSAAILVI
jgi:hypothetical protein